MKTLMMNAFLGTWLVGTALFSQTVLAQEFKVGRATVSFATSGWVGTEVPDKGVDYSGEVSGTIPSETRILLNQGVNNEVLAVMIVSASKGGMSNGYMTYNPSCVHNQAMLAEGNTGSQLSYAECLIVYPLFTTSSLLKNISESESLIIKSARVKLPDSMQLIDSSYSNSNGSHMTARIMLAPGFSGLKPTGTAEADPVFSWAREFMKAVKNGVNSFRGRVEIPAIEFKQDSPEKKIVQIESLRISRM